jgi:hypothetical protein
MNNLQEQSFSDFETLLAPWTSAYLCADISYVGLKTSEGARLLFGRILLVPARTGVGEIAFQFETEHIIAARFVSSTTPADIQSFLAKARNGEILANDGACLSIKPDGTLSVYFSPIHHPAVSDGPRLPSLQVRGTSKHHLIVSVADPRVLDWELKAAAVPFDNLDELLMQCNLPTQIQMGDMTTLEIVANSPVMINETSTITAGNAVIVCNLAAALDSGKLRLGYKVLHKNSVDRTSVSGTELDWRQEGDVKVGTYKMPIGDASLLQAFVSYAGISHHQWWITDPRKRLNPRFAIHQIFDGDLKILEKMLLKPEADKSQMFEGAVSTLLNLLGFSVTNYGRAPKLQDGPDIIAVAPSGHISVIECTVGLLDRNDKLAKLVQRSKLIREKLDQAGYGFLQIQALIVSPLTRDEVTADLETAGKLGIAVACKEDLEEMLKAVSLPLNADKVFNDVKNLVPNSGQGNFFNVKL